MNDTTPSLGALAHAIHALARAVEQAPASTPAEELFVAERGGARLGTLVLKRTYAIRGGRCLLAPDEAQSPLCFVEVPYAELSPPRISPLIADDESFAFRDATDVVVQASAYAYAPKTTQTVARLRFGAVQREIVVTGDRRGDFDRMGRPCFSDPQPFEAIPVRWDHAYGGFDKWAWKRHGLGPEDAAGPDYTTRYHYPRNPAGRGYLLELDDESFAGLAIPNLEHPFDSLTPGRLSVGGAKRWARGPLPAAWDFQPVTWFPRCGYLGLAPAREPEEEGWVPEEAARGWAPRDILSTPSFLQADGADDLRRGFMQSAAPGLAVASLAPDERFELTNLHPKEPVYAFELPGEIPRVTFELEPGKATEAAPHLAAVVVRVDLGEVEMLWSARVELPAALTNDDLAAAKRAVAWHRPKKG